MEIGQKLKESRTAAGLSQEALAQQLGVTRQTVSSWEKNRSYPDIGSLVKLSDLYGLSLDELLKEDPVMRKHVEDNSVLPRKYWNRLFEIAILLNPFGSLVGFWGAPWVGLILRLIGAVMLPPLWVARHKLFGMPRDEMKTSIKGWALWIIGSFVAVLGGYSSLVGHAMSITGLMMIYANGVYLERGTRFWLVIALYIGIPIYIYGSGFMAQFHALGAYSEAQPFGSDYRIVSVEYGTEPEDHPTINLDHVNNLRFDGKLSGEFTYIEPREEQTVKGIWQLVPKDEPNGLYKLEVSAEDETTLAYFVDDQLQWRWEIEKIPTLHLALRTSAFDSASQIEWFPEERNSVDPAEINYTRLTGTGTAFVQCSDKSITEFTVTEEYHFGNQVETKVFCLEKDKNDEFPFPEALSKRYDGQDQYAIYSIEWAGGVFIIRLNFN